MTNLYYLPVELKSREFLAKMLLASTLLERGASVLIGKRVSSGHPAFVGKKVRVLTKSAAAIDDKQIAGFVNAGHEVFSLDEEGLLMASLDTFVKKRFSHDNVKRVKGFLCWGTAQCRALQEQYPAEADKFIVSGNPRAELWANRNFGIYDSLVGSIKETYGDYVFFPSTFAVSSPFKKESVVERLTNFGYIDGAEELKAFEEVALKLVRMRDAFAHAIVEIIKKPGVKVVVRPHPSEDADFWLERFKGNPAVVVTNNFSVSPWAMGAKALLHNSCTTAIEAGMYNVPTIAYKPNGDAHGYDVNLGNVASHEVENLPALIELIEGALEGRLLPKESPVALGEYLMEPTGTCDRISDALVTGDMPGPVKIQRCYKPLIKGILKHAMIKVDQAGVKVASSGMKYSYAKFPFTYASEVRNVMSEILARRLLKYKFDASQVDSNLFLLTRR